MKKLLGKNKYYRAFRTLYRIIGKEHSGKLVWIGFVMSLSAIIELFLILSILPFVAYIQSPEAGRRILVHLPGVLVNNSVFIQYQFYIISFTVLFLIVFGNAINIYNVWLTSRFSFMQVHFIGEKYLQLYLKQPYSFFLKQNKAETANRIFSQILAVPNGIISPLLTLVARGIQALVIFFLLLFYDPMVAISTTIILGGVYIIVYYLFKNKNKKVASEVFHAREASFRILSESLSGIKEIKLKNFENIYLKSFAKRTWENANGLAVNNVITYFPRYFLEAVAMGIAIMIVVFLFRSGAGSSAVITTVSLYVFAGYRVMPALQLVYTSIVTIRHHWINAVQLEQDFVMLEQGHKKNGKNTTADLLFKNSISLKNINFSYQGTTTKIFNNFSIEIPYGSIVGIAGKTGSGKSTLIDILLGLLEPDSGEVEIDGVTLTHDNMGSWQKKLGYVPQNIYISDDTVRRNIAFGEADTNIDENRILKVAEISDISGFVEKMDNKYDTIVGEEGIRVSGGQRQRIGIARALYYNPEVLVLDEATSALDIETEKKVIKAMRGVGSSSTIIMIAHRLDTLRDCDFILDLDSRKILKGRDKTDFINK